jgi:hypothetical protein
MKHSTLFVCMIVILTIFIAMNVQVNAANTNAHAHAHTDSCSDARDRLNALEKELAQVKNELKELLKSLAHRETSWHSYVEMVKEHAVGLSGHVRHLGSHGLGMAKAYVPIIMDHVHHLSKDLPGHSKSLYSLVEASARSYSSLAYQSLSTILSTQGVPKQYVNYVTIGILAAVGLAIVLITFTIISTILSVVFSILCCRRKKTSSSSSSKKKKNKSGQAQPNQQQQQHS